MEQHERIRTADTLPLTTQTARQLPAHRVRPDGTASVRPSRTANVEGPIIPGTLVTQRFQRNSEGAFFERKVAADIIIQLGAVVESKGYTATIRVDVLDAIWARYDSGDYGKGKAGIGIYTDIPGLPAVWVVDDDLLASPSRPLAATRGPQRIQLAHAITRRR